MESPAQVRIEDRALGMVYCTLKIVFGLVPIVAGIGVLLTPWTRVFAWIVGLWLIGISLNLVLAGYYDVAVRDIVMAISAFCLARLCAVAPSRVAAADRLRHAEAR